MPINQNKINAFKKKVSDLLDEPTQDTATIKAWFDSSPDELRQSHNALIDSLQGTANGDSGPDNIGVTPIAGVGDGNTNTVMKVLLALKGLIDNFTTQIQNIVLGQIPDGTLTDVKLSNAPGQLKDTVNTHMADGVKHISATERVAWNNDIKRRQLGVKI